MNKFGCASAIQASLIAFGLHKFSENRIFTDADDYSMEIELPLAGCDRNIDIFGNLTRKDIDTEQIFFDAVLQDTNFRKRGAVVITGITQAQDDHQRLMNNKSPKSKRR